jgi:hypothetical protein
MSTIFYLPSSGSAPVTVTPSGTDWDGHINTVTRPLNLVRGSSALTSLAYAPDGADHLTDVATMIAQYVSQVLPPQTIAAQQIGCGSRALESNALNNLFLAWKLYGVSIDGSSNLGVIKAIAKEATEFGTALTGAAKIAAGSATTFNVPWRLVLEVGADGLPTTGGGRHNFTWVEGEAMATGAMNFIQDADTTAATPALVFSKTVDCCFTPHIGARIGI